MVELENSESFNDFVDHKGEFVLDNNSITIGKILKLARNEKGLTQEELANLSKTNKAYISKVEKDLIDLKFSTFKRIIESGLGGKLELSIRL